MSVAEAVQKLELDFTRLDIGRFDINHPPEKPTPVTSPAVSQGRAQAIQAELKAIDADFRRTGFYPPAAQLRYVQLTRERAALNKSSRQ